MDLTPEAAIYRACAEASWEAPGTQRLWRSYQRDTYLELMLARPDFCALVDVAYRAGREDAAKAIEQDPHTRDCHWDTADPWWNGYDAAKERAVEVVRGATSLGRSSGGDEHNAERGSE